MVLGIVSPLWMRITNFIDQNYNMVGDLIYGGEKYGWNVWYRKSGKTLLSLYPKQNEFIAQVVLSKDQVEEALSLTNGEYVRRVLVDTPSLHDGRWLFIKVRNEIDVSNVEQLLLVKRRPKNKPGM